MAVTKTDLARLAGVRHSLRLLHRELHERGSWDRMWDLEDLMRGIDAVEERWQERAWAEASGGHGAGGALPERLSAS